MDSLNKQLKNLTKHLDGINKTFLKKSNYSNLSDFEWYKLNYKKFEKLAKDTSSKWVNIANPQSGKKEKVWVSFSNEIYHQGDRQMKLADIIEFLFFSRGIYFIFQGDGFRKDRVSIFLKLILRYVNLLMVLETVTVDKKLRDSLLKKLEVLLKDDIGFKEFKKWKFPVGLAKNHPAYKKDSPNDYFDSILPKTAGGLWHEMLVFAFILKYNIGYIFPLLINQKPISLDHKLSPPDLIILHKTTYRYYGIEIGNFKERQSGGFTSPSGLPIIAVDTGNARTDRCPSCSKWIGICEKVIDDFSNIENIDYPATNEIRCLVECNKFTLEDKLNGKCPVMKFAHKTKGEISGFKFDFADKKHHHYNCCKDIDNKIVDAIKDHKKYPDLEKLDSLIQKKNLSTEEEQWKEDALNKIRDKKGLYKDFHFIKTHSIYYQEFRSLIKMNKIMHDTSNTT